MEATIGCTKVEIIEGNIVDQATDAVVNAARNRLTGGNGVDGWIHRRGGAEILRQCQAIGYCATGEAVITTGGNLPARYVIHAVGPVYTYDANPAELLSKAYCSSLRRAVEAKLRSVSFPSISTGAYCFPMKQAAPIAMRATLSFLDSVEHMLNLVRIVVYPKESPTAYRVFAEVLRAAVKNR